MALSALEKKIYETREALGLLNEQKQESGATSDEPVEFSVVCRLFFDRENNLLAYNAEKKFS